MVRQWHDKPSWKPFLKFKATIFSKPHKNYAMTAQVYLVFSVLHTSSPHWDICVLHIAYECVYNFSFYDYLHIKTTCLIFPARQRKRPVHFHQLVTSLYFLVLPEPQVQTCLWPLVLQSRQTGSPELESLTCNLQGHLEYIKELCFKIQ